MHALTDGTAASPLFKSQLLIQKTVSNSSNKDTISFFLYSEPVIALKPSGTATFKIRQQFVPPYYAVSSM
jgi:hypothetical protein